MLARYVLADLVRNPRRTLATMVGVVLGVGLFCGVLFIVDGLAASMTQRAVAPLAIDMQRIVTERVGGAITLTQRFDPPGPISAGEQAQVILELHNTSAVAANEVTLRSQPGGGVLFIARSAQFDGRVLPGFQDNPFAHGAGMIGFNLGTIEPGSVRRITYLVTAEASIELSDSAITSTYSSRESVIPVEANKTSTVHLEQLAQLIGGIAGVAQASQLSFADLGAGTLSAAGIVAKGPAKIFGFDADYAIHDRTVRIVEGALSPDGGVLSAEAARQLSAKIGDTVTVSLPDTSTIDITISGIADLSRARSLFTSRRGGDLETFIYTRNSIIVSSRTFAAAVLTAYERAAAERGTRLKSPPVREIDITLDRALLDADPSTALVETQRIGAEVKSVAAHQDYLLDNISNTLAVAAADASTAKRLFVFLGLPAGLLAAILAAYAGSVLAEGLRREQATLRIRGASRRHLRRMLILRTGLLTGVGSIFGLVIGYLAAASLLGQESLNRASTSSLIASALIGTLGGFAATGTALYVTGRRSIDREINEDRAHLTTRPPVWRRFGLDMIGVGVVVIGTVVALLARAFDGAAGSVYFGKFVELNLALLILPIAVWITGCLLAARICGLLLARSQPRSRSSVGRPLPSLYRFSVGRRPWAIANGAIVVALIVAFAVSLGGFTASYDAAKANDARYATGSDIRITPSPTSERTYGVLDAGRFQVEGVVAVSPVIYGLSNVIVRSARTSDPANLAAIDPETFASIAPVTNSQFASGNVAAELARLRQDSSAVLLSQEMAAFLQVEVGDPLYVLLARATPEQIEIELSVTGLFERLPGFPDGVDAVISLSSHMDQVPTKAPDFFLAKATSYDDAALELAFDQLRQGPGSVDDLQIDTRANALARDQSSLAALNISGLVRLDLSFALSMAAVVIAIFVFGLLLQRRREYITLRAQGLEPRTIRLLIAAEASTVALAGSAAGVLVGTAMGYYFTTVLRPLFVLTPEYSMPFSAILIPVALVFAATIISAVAASRLVNGLEPTELLRDE